MRQTSVLTIQPVQVTGESGLREELHGPNANRLIDWLLFCSAAYGAYSFKITVYNKNIVYNLYNFFLMKLSWMVFRNAHPIQKPISISFLAERCVAIWNPIRIFSPSMESLPRSMLRTDTARLYNTTIKIMQPVIPSYEDYMKQISGGESIL